MAQQTFVNWQTVVAGILAGVDISHPLLLKWVTDIQNTVTELNTNYPLITQPYNFKSINDILLDHVSCYDIQKIDIAMAHVLDDLVTSCRCGNVKDSHLIFSYEDADIDNADAKYNNIKYHIAYLACAPEFEFGNLFNDFVYTHANRPDIIEPIVKIIGDLPKQDNYIYLGDDELYEYAVIGALSMVKKEDILLTSSPFTRARNGLYLIAVLNSGNGKNYAHPADYISHIIFRDNRLSLIRRNVIKAICVDDYPTYKFDDHITNAELDAVIQKKPVKFMDIYNSIQDNLVNVLGGAPNTPLDILKELLTVLKEDTQKLAGHYDALRRHLVQFAQNINNADVPHSKAPVDYSGLMEKYQELYRENEKLRRENKKLRHHEPTLKQEQEKPAAPLLVAQLAQMAKDDDLARSLKKTYQRPVSRRDANDSDAMMVMRALRDIVDALPQPR
jgi:hypothetical protein